ncbi:MAG: hypothetical protein ACOYO1_13970 [Bacteroidales bacterium]
MKSWLEEIEEQEQKKEALSDKAKKRIQIKKEKAALNYQQNGAKYDKFISRLNELVHKVNNFPEDERIEFIEIDARLKETEFDNKLFVFSSSKRVSIRKMTFFFFGKEIFRFKHIRVIYFSISKEMGKVDIEYKEKFLPKGHHEKYTTKDSHYLYELDFDILTEELAYRIINWLAFKEGEAEFTLKQS